MSRTSVGRYSTCSTEGLRNLDLQLIHQVNVIAPGMLVSFAHLPVSLGAAVHPFLQDVAVEALEKVLKGRSSATMTINSAYRTIAQQEVLHGHMRNRRCGIAVAAVPGKSNHNTGLALDIEDYNHWRETMEVAGWDWYGSKDDVHFDYVGRGTRDLRSTSIKAFQQLWNLNNLNNASLKLQEDGCWGLATASALQAAPTDGFCIVPGYSPELVATAQPKRPRSTPSLRKGMEGDEVVKLQKSLRKLGYDVEADGIFGSGTLSAVKTYQGEVGIVADGVVGMATREALRLV